MNASPEVYQKENKLTASVFIPASTSVSSSATFASCKQTSAIDQNSRHEQH